MPATRHDVDRKHDNTHNNTHTRRALVLEVQQPDSASIWPGKAAAITERAPPATPPRTPAGLQHTEALISKDLAGRGTEESADVLV